MPFSFFKRIRKQPPQKKLYPITSTLHVDVHAQLLPGRQDGTDSVDHSISLLRELAGFGFQKVVATLHIMDGFYQNTHESIFAAANLLNDELQRLHIPMKVQPSAEYFLDTYLLRLLYAKADLLTFGPSPAQQYLLFDTSLVKRPLELEKVITAIRQRQLIPLMAHPEQYTYLQKEPEALQLMHHQGVRFQMNLLSLTGQPSVQTRQLAEWMIDRKLVSFVGTDVYHESQIPAIRQAQALPYYRKALDQGLLNDSLL